MSDLRIDASLLRSFEEGLNLQNPGASSIPATVLGYGEISTVLEIDAEDARNLAFKRMPMFKNMAEVESYSALYREYTRTLDNSIGISVVPGAIQETESKDGRRVVAYLVQEKLPGITIGHKVIHHVSDEDVRRLLLAILRELKKVFDFNDSNHGELEIGIDGQISNWSVAGFDPANAHLTADTKLVYFDTGTPLMRKRGKELLDPELFLRSTPWFLVWILRLFFLNDVMNRYYDFRRVTVDLIANLYKEQRADLVPALVNSANDFFSTQTKVSNHRSITVSEVKSYYRQDALIWRLYLAFRKLDRSLHRLLHREYPYILPSRIRR